MLLILTLKLTFLVRYLWMIFDLTLYLEVLFFAFARTRRVRVVIIFVNEKINLNHPQSTLKYLVCRSQLLIPSTWYVLLCWNPWVIVIIQFKYLKSYKGLDKCLRDYMTNRRHNLEYDWIRDIWYSMKKWYLPFRN